MAPLEGSAVAETVKATGLDQLWLGRAAAMAERESLELPLAQVSAEISFLDHVNTVLRQNGLYSAYVEMRRAAEEADRDHRVLEASKGAVSVWDSLNPFSESDAEREARHASESLSGSQCRARQLAEDFHASFDACLKAAHPPLLVCALNNELAAGLQMVHAECASYTKRHTSDGHTHTTTYYYCTLRGMEPVRDALQRLAIATEPEPGSIVSTLAALELRSLLDCDSGGQVTALLGPGGI